MKHALTNRRILLGVTGGIAAYKSAELVRRLQEQGAEVQVVMTRAATEFITPLTMQALSGYPVHLDLLDTQAEAAMGHIELARWADRVLVAPATADFLARLAQGRSDDLLGALCLATPAPLIVAPAMNQGMWHDQATQDNIHLLRSRSISILGPAEGLQACGDVGLGRMLEPVDIAQGVAASFVSGVLQGQRVVITAGPTREALDPVRFISNHSSGKMGYALARAAVDAGASVTLITGPVALSVPDRVTAVHVESAQEMYAESLQHAGHADIFIAAAAVADYRPESVATQKIKKEGDVMTLRLIKNPDIVQAVSASVPRPYTVGFAAETSSLERYAQNKLEQKKLDLIVANDVSLPGIGFNSDNNEVTLFWKGGAQVLAQATKECIAADIIRHIAVLRAGVEQTN